MSLEGWLYKRGEKGLVKSWRHRYFRQQKDIIDYYKSDTSQESLGSINLQEVFSVHPTSDVKEKEFCFQVNTEARIFYLKAEKETEFHFWVAGISAYIKESGIQDKLVLARIQKTEKIDSKRNLKKSNSRKSDTNKKVKNKDEEKPKPLPGIPDNTEEVNNIPLIIPDKPMPNPKDISPRDNKNKNASPRKKECDNNFKKIKALGKGTRKKSIKSEPREKPQKIPVDLVEKHKTEPNLDSTDLNLKQPDESDSVDDLSITSDDEEDIEIDISNKRVIGINIVGAPAPQRNPPPPPIEGEEKKFTIKVVGRVATATDRDSNRATTWITRSKQPLPTRANTSFLKNRASLFIDKDCSHRTKLVREVLSSEDSYVTSLYTLVHHYYIPLSSCNDKRVTKDIKTIFGNVEQILKLNSDFLFQLQHRLSNWTDTELLGDLFINVAPFLKLYATYGTNYEKAITIYQKEMKENIAFKDAVETKNLEAGTNVHLHHLLIMPIQRIPRYKMLLGDIIKNTQQSHPDYNNLLSALDKIQNVATHLNESVRASEMEKNLLELAQRMDITLLLEPHRHLIHEGAYRIIVGKKEKHNLHHLILFNDILICISKSKLRKQQEFKNSHNNSPLSLVWFEETKHDRHKCLKITYPSHSFIVLFESDEELNSWKKALQSGILSLLKSQVQNQDSLNDSDKLPALRYGSFEYTNKTRYTGWFSNGKKEGLGEFIFGYNKYEGNFVQDSMWGKGKFTFASGEIYDGYWEDGLPSGEGTFGSPSGDIYTGKYINGSKEGKGHFVYSNGDVYDGEFAKNVPHGKGKFIYSTNKRYEGDWVNGQRSGFGVFDYGNGSSYEGEWLQDKRHGKGTLVECDGSYYEGEFINGLAEGQGVMVFKDGRKYSGQWKAGKAYGQGLYSSAVGRVSSLEAEWVNGTVQGKGNVVFANNDSYTGGFKDNWINGNGVYTHGNTTIEGKWNMGNLEGKVTIKINSIDEPITGTITMGNCVQLFEEPNAPPLLLPFLTTFLSVDL